MNEFRSISERLPLRWSRVPLLNPKWLYVSDLLRELVSRQLKLLYKRSYLGLGWALVLPLLQLLIFSFVFRIVLRVQVANYPSFAFTGLLVWTWVMTSLVESSVAITANRPLLRQPGFPISILPVATVACRLIHMLLALPVLLAFLVVQNVPITWNILYLPLLIALQFALILCFAYPVAALNVTLRDTQHILAVLMQLVMYVTPIFYSLENVPERFRFFFVFNPLVYLVQGYRDILVHGRPPDWAALAGLTGLAAILLPLGLALFRRQKNRFAEEL